MTGADNQPEGRAPTRWQGWMRQLLVTLTFVRDPDARRIRARTLMIAAVLVFALAGAVRVSSPMQLLANSPFNLDLALRTLSAGWFQPRDVIAVTLVEIDEATHRAWGSPAVTPRQPLVDLLATASRVEIVGNQVAGRIQRVAYGHSLSIYQDLQTGSGASENEGVRGDCA